jgi:hypothetical protein
MESIRAAGIDFVIWSWWGKDSFSDHSLRYWWQGLENNNPPGLKHCIYYEKEWLENVPYDEIKSDLNYIKAKYAGSNTAPNPNYLRIADKAVTFVYNSTPTKYRGQADYQVKLSEKWANIRKVTATYTVLKVFKDWTSYKTRADSWHQYAPSTPYAKHAPYSSYASPGWWSPKEDKPRLARDTARFDSNIKTLASDGTPLKTIQTFNEWTEGTGIEGASINGKSHDNSYLDIVAKYFKV